MKDVPYPFTSPNGRKFYFVSEGKISIHKVVEFIPTEREDTVNLAFGDIINGNDYIDQKISNNGDIRKVMTTVIHIIIEFTTLYPFEKIFFMGNTLARVRLYRRIIKNYYADFQKQFVILAFTERNYFAGGELYKPENSGKYICYLIRRKSKKQPNEHKK